MAPKKIQTYESNQINTRSGFRAPTLKDATVGILQGVSRVTNDVLDKRAAEEGKTQGFTDVNKGSVTIKQAEAKPNTIRGAAYKDGARASFVAKKKNEYETALTEVYNQNKFDSEKYNKEKDRLRSELLTATPLNLQQGLSIDFDSTSNKFKRQIDTNLFNREEAEQLKNQTDRLTTIIDRIEDGIIRPEDSTGDGVEADVAEAFALLNGLYNTQKKIDVKTLGTYTDLIFNNILNAEIKNAYEAAVKQGKGAEFIENLDKGGHKTFLKEIGEVYGDEIKKALPQFEVPSTISESAKEKIIKSLQIEEKQNFKLNETARSNWEVEAKKALALYKGGVEPGYIFDSEKMRELGFKESTILKYEASFRIAEQVYPDIIDAKSIDANANATNLKSLQTEYYSLQNKTTKTDKDREDLLVLGQKIDGIQTVLSNQRKYIQDGDVNLLFDQAGMTYDTSTVDGLKEFHKQAEEVFGLDSNLMKVAPQSQLDQDAEAVTTGGFQAITAMSEKYGEYFETFIVDSGLDKQGYITVAQLVNNGNPALAEQMFNALNDLDANTKSAKNLHGDFTGSEGALGIFEGKFQKEFGAFMTGNQDQADDVMNGARALWTQIYLRTGNEQKASAGVIQNFKNNFTQFEFKGMKVLLPKGVDSDAITTELEIIANNPQKKGIMTNSLFDVNDFKEDFADNSFENYGLAIDGGKIKIINNENAMGVVTVFKKLPSGSGELAYTNTITINTKSKDENKEDSASQETVIKDVVDIWNYESKVGNKKFTSVVDNTIAMTESEYQKNKSLYDSQQKEIEESIGKNVNLYEKYKAFDENNDGNITGNEWAKAQDFQSKQNEKLIDEPNKVTTYNKVEKLMFEYAKLENAPTDEGIGFVSKDATTHKQLQAISMYIKSGEITDWIVDYLSDLESFEALENKEIRDEVLANWKNNMNRTTDTNPPTTMSPITSLYDFVRDLEDKVSESNLKDLIKTTEDGTEYIPFG